MFCMQISFCLTSVCKSGGKTIGEITPGDKTVLNP